MTRYKPSRLNKSALTTPPVEIISLFSHSIFCHWECVEGRFILLGQIIIYRISNLVRYDSYPQFIFEDAEAVENDSDDGSDGDIDDDYDAIYYDYDTCLA